MSFTVLLIFQIAQVLLRSGAEVNVHDRTTGASPLHRAASKYDRLCAFAYFNLCMFVLIHTNLYRSLSSFAKLLHCSFHYGTKSFLEMFFGLVN